MDKYQALRELPFPLVMEALGLSGSDFKSRKGGTEWAGKCPIHGAKTNSTAFSYNQDGRFGCFSCNGKGRGALDLVVQVRKVGFKEAVAFLEPLVGRAIAERTLAEAPKPQLKTLQEPVTENKPFKASYEKYFKPHPWLAERGLEQATLDRYGVGFYQNDSRQSAYNGSVMLKIRRYSDGECVGYLSRNVGEITPEKPKYRFPAGLHKGLELFGAWQLKSDGHLPLRICYLVESPFTVMAYHQKGLPAVSPYGWSLTDSQVNMLANIARGFVCLPDRDKADEFASHAHVLSRVAWVRCPSLPDGTDDPEHLTADQIRNLTSS